MVDKTQYKKGDIYSVDDREHVRMRAGMYIGSVDTPRQLLLEAFVNALDEVQIGHGNTIKVTINKDFVKVEDEGQGIPVNEKRDDGLTTLQACYSVMQTSGKYDEETGVYSSGALGTMGVGSKAICFLSKKLIVKSCRGGYCETAEFEDGFLVNSSLDKVEYNKHGVTVEFTPDPQFFDSPKIDINEIESYFHYICGLVPNLHIILNGKEIHHPDGLEYLLNEEIKNNISLIDSKLLIDESNELYRIQLGLTYTSNTSIKFKPLVNLGETEGGPHITAVKSTITRVINKWAKDEGILKAGESNLDGASLQEGMICIFNITAPAVRYDNQIKTKVLSKDFIPFVNSILANKLEVWLDTHPNDGKIIVEKALVARRATEAAKKAREAVRKKATAATPKEKLFALPTKLTDCWSKDRTKCELFIAEGLSAASGLVAARDSENQAVYGIRGKMLNALKTTESRIVKNQEINNIILALGLDYNPKNGKMKYDKNKLRYDKIIAAADADYDGFAIENLLFNVLWYLCPELITNGHVYSAVPPLFRVTTKKNEYVYLKDEKALNLYKKDNEKKIQSIGRLKGLGEQDSDELSYCLLDPSTRNIMQLTVSDYEKTDNLFQSLYGKAVEPRVKFIMEHSEEARVE